MGRPVTNAVWSRAHTDTITLDRLTEEDPPVCGVFACDKPARSTVWAVWADAEDNVHSFGQPVDVCPRHAPV